MPSELPGLARRAERIEAALARISEAQAAQAARLVALERELRQDIEAARAAPAQPDMAPLAVVAAENQRLAAELAALREEMARIAGARDAAREAEARLAQARLDEERLAAERRAEAGRDARLAAAVAALRGALATGGDAGPGLAELRALAPGHPRLAAALAPVEALATAPPPPGLEELRARFAGLAAAALRAARAPSAPASWWEAAMARLGALASLRRVGEVEGDDAEALLARAERRLAAGDLAAAADLVARLDGPAARELAPWLAQARARAALDAALAGLARAAAPPG